MYDLNPFLIGLRESGINNSVKIIYFNILFQLIIKLSYLELQKLLKIRSFTWDLTCKLYSLVILDIHYVLIFFENFIDM